MDNKHFALLIDEEYPNGFVLFSDYYENIKEQIDSLYEEIEYNISELKWDTYLINNPYKTFKIKNKEHEQNDIGTGIEE